MGFMPLLTALHSGSGYKAIRNGLAVFGQRAPLTGRRGLNLAKCHGYSQYVFCMPMLFRDK
jgi:hypothetical protein